jgi:hypothetical protein
VPVAINYTNGLSNAETVTEDHEVSETLRKEQIDEPDTDTGTTSR